MAKKKTTVPEKRDDLIVQKLGEEMIVYDRGSHRAHSLNRSAALVFEKLDGKHDLGGVARELGKTLGTTGRSEIVATAVNELAAANLLKPGADLPRRAILRGLAAGLVPVVVSIAVPAAAAAGSCVPDGGSCYYNTECCSGDCDSPGGGSGFGCGYSFTYACGTLR